METNSVFLTKIVDAVDSDQVHSAESAKRDAGCDDANGEMGHSWSLQPAPKTRSSAVTEPFVARTSARIISNEGFCFRLSIRVIEAVVVPALTASDEAVWPSRER